MSNKKHNINKAIAFFLMLFVVLLIPHKSKAFQRKETAVTVVLEPSDKKGNFRARKPVKFNITIKNPLSNDQEGTMVYNVNNENGETVITNSLDVKVNAKKKLESSFEVEIDQEGSYTLNATIELSDFNETITRNFAYSGPPRKVKDRRNIPSPYDQNWSRYNIDNKDAYKKESLVKESEKTTKEEEPADDQEEEGEIITTIKPSNKDGLYNDNKNIKYNVTLVNKYKSKQEGTFTIFVKTDIGEPVGEKEVKIKLSRRGIKKFSVVLPSVKEPGVYNLSAALNLSSYDDTTHHAFGYKISSINTPFYLPPDFDDFWKKAIDELAQVPPQYKITLDEGQSTYFHTVYKVEVQSLGNITCFGWLSIPKPKGKYPVLIGFGGYKIELNPLYYDDFITFTFNVRGIDRKINEQINPEHKEQIVLNIEDKNEYVYRGIYMDCIRAVEFVYSHAEMGMDLGRVAVFGGSQGASMALITAALMPGKVNTVVANNPTFFDWKRDFEIAKTYSSPIFPFSNFNEYAIMHPEVTHEVMLQTLHYFETQNFMPKIKCPVLFAVGLLDQFIPAASELAGFNKMNREVINKSELYVFSNLGHEVPRSHEALISLWFYEKTAQKK